MAYQGPYLPTPDAISGDQDFNIPSPGRTHIFKSYQWLKTTNIYDLRSKIVSEDEESRGSLAVWFHLRVFHEVVAKLSARGSLF